MYNFFKEPELFQNEILSTTEKLLNKIKSSEIVFKQDLSYADKTSFHFLSEILHPSTRIEKTLYASLFSSMKKTEITSAGSSYVFLLVSLFLIKNLLKNKNLLELNNTFVSEEFDKILETIKITIQRNSVQTKNENLEKEIEFLCKNKYLSTVIKEAINLAGLEGIINTEDNKTENYTIELKNGFCFKLNPFNFFLKDNLWSEQNVKLLVIDGVLEKISEIDKLLSKTIETKIPMVIVAHKFSEEIIATLKCNSDREIINILPVRLPMDLDSLNVLNDIAIVSGCDVVSSLKGEQIQFIKYDDIPTVQKIRCTSKEFIIENNKNINNISNHINYLLKKREENQIIEDISNLIDQRIKSLLSQSVTICIPNVSTSEKIDIKTKIDISLRMCKTLLGHGFINLNSFLEDFQNNNKKSEFEKLVSDCLFQTIKEINIKDIPSLSLFIAIQLAIKTVIPLILSKGFVENES